MKKYTKAEKARIRGMIQVFKATKFALTDGSRGICSHIPRAHAAQRAKIDAYNLIERALDPYHWFHNWVRDHNSHLGRVEDYGLKMTKLRKRWLDQLIADCEAAL